MALVSDHSADFGRYTFSVLFGLLFYLIGGVEFGCFGYFEFAICFGCLFSVVDVAGDLGV